MGSDTLLIAIVLLPFLGSVLAALVPFPKRNIEAWLAGAVALVALCLVGLLFPYVNDGGVLRSEIEWAPSLGLAFTLRMDGFAWMFALLVTGIGLLVTVYSRYYMSRDDPIARYYCYLLAFMGAMLGVVLSGNLIQLAFFWELTSLFSFLLIGYWHDNANAREGARMALTITAGGGLCLFAGVILLGHIVGSYDLDRVLKAGDVIRYHPLYTPTLVLILLGALTKSAQFPFHFWLPHAMAAPTPISAYLHSATLVKAGVFLLARLWPVMAGTQEWPWIVGTAGLITFVVGAYLAIFQDDIKGLLAYSTVSHLGLITLLLGLNTGLAAVAAIFHMMNHATFKASLFMAAGIIDHEAGTRDMKRLSGLRALMPITATLAMVASAAMAGVPLLNGFLSKEMFFVEALTAVAPTAALQGLLPYAATIASAFAVAYSLRFIIDVFFGPPPVDLPRKPQEPPRWMRFPVELLVLICLVVGIIPAITVGPFLDAAVRAVLGPATPGYSLSMWHGFTPAMMMSVIAIAGGTALYLLLERFVFRQVEGPPLLRHVHGRRIFGTILVFLSWRLSRSLEQVLGTRRLQPQLALVVAAAVAAAAVPLFLRGVEAGPVPLMKLDMPLVALWLVGVVCAIGAAYLAEFHRLAALILMGTAGLVCVVNFVWFSAPDLALTQLLVEIVTTVLFLLGLRWLPKQIKGARIETRRAARRVRDFVIALVGGAGLALLTYAVLTRPLPDSISRFFLENAYSQGGGTNVVNVILVDFRGFDTLGEITVLGIVSLAVFALLRRFRPARDSIELPEQQRRAAAQESGEKDARKPAIDSDDMIVPGLIVRILFPVIGATAVYLLMRGHDLPGGGFVAGLTMSIAFIVQYIAGGTRWVEARLRVLPVKWIGAGLMVAGLTGAGAWLFGYPFLTSDFRYVAIPIIGTVPLPSALLFDLGVFLLVMGATVLILIALAHQSIRRHRPAAATPAVAAEAARWSW